MHTFVFQNAFAKNYLIILLALIIDNRLVSDTYLKIIQAMRMTFLVGI